VLSEKILSRSVSGNGSASYLDLPSKPRRWCVNGKGVVRTNTEIEFFFNTNKVVSYQDHPLVDGLVTKSVT
jgi:hypothetical protein